VDEPGGFVVVGDMESVLVGVPVPFGVSTRVGVPVTFGGPALVEVPGLLGVPLLVGVPCGSGAPFLGGDSVPAALLGRSMSVGELAVGVDGGGVTS
jgi:hypothetical protein